MRDFQTRRSGLSILGSTERLSCINHIFIGVAELLAALGLSLPGVTRILPWLTALAAAGLMIVMGSATMVHVFRGEIGSAISTMVLFVLVTVVAYKRWKVTAPRAEAPGLLSVQPHTHPVITEGLEGPGARC